MSGYTGWLIPDQERDRLLEMFPPSNPDVLAHHITHTFPATILTKLPFEKFGEIVGYADDDLGVQALVIAISGNVDRTDGSVYHCTWSIDRSKKRKPVHSNQIIKTHGWTRLPIMTKIELVPTFFS